MRITLATRATRVSSRILSSAGIAERESITRRSESVR
jgi:hypothetical protein